eukprot:NODE_111_length_18624_cov_1.285020.p8 type:complete len:232 gc:universal NODE_111_length_18624_cov_1.285020:3308-2613(-)
MLLQTLLFASVYTFNTVDSLVSAMKKKDVLLFVTVKDCQFCKRAEPIYTQISEHLTGQADHMFYGKIDLSDVPAFGSRLKIKSAPQIYLFNRQKVDRLGDAHFYTFSMDHFDEEKLVKFISRYGNFEFSYSKTLSRDKIMLGIATGFGIMLGGALLWPLISKLLGNRRLWLALTVGAVLLFTTGQMFVQMRHMPEHGRNEDGTNQLVQPGFQGQFGYEAKLMSSLCSNFLM